MFHKTDRFIVKQHIFLLFMYPIMFPVSLFFLICYIRYNQIFPYLIKSSHPWANTKKLKEDYIGQFFPLVALIVTVSTSVNSYFSYLPYISFYSSLKDKFNSHFFLEDFLF